MIIYKFSSKFVKRLKFHEKEGNLMQDILKSFDRNGGEK